MIRQMIPQQIRRNIRDTWFLYELNRVRRSMEQSPEGLPTRRALQALTRAWGNIEWAANIDYQLEVCRRTLQTTGPILECGSGLTTILMGLLAESRKLPVWSLEHEPTWRKRVQSVVQRAGLSTVQLQDRPLQSYGDFAWYEKPPTPPAPFTLVICDAPPGNTPGGRSGLLPVMADTLAPGCIILLDDAERPGEIETLRRWKEGWDISVECVGQENPPARAIVTWAG